MRARVKAKVVITLRDLANNIVRYGHYKDKAGQRFRFTDADEVGECCLIVNPAYKHLGGSREASDGLHLELKKLALSKGFKTLVSYSDKTETHVLVKDLNNLADQLESELK